MRVLVTGGRDYTDRDTAWKVLDALHKTQPITEIIHGAARGADTLADHWALAREVRRQLFPVSKEDWEKYGKSAGHRRNRLMCTPRVLQISCSRSRADPAQRAWSTSQRKQALLSSIRTRS